MSHRRNSTARPRKPVSQRPASRPWTARLKLPPFLPVPLRTRRDGWTPGRQARFIGLLAQFGCVRRAAAALGLSRESAYRLRRHAGAGSFRAAWDTAVRGVAQAGWKFTGAERRPLALSGPFHVRLWQGRPAAIYRKPCDSRLLSEGNALARLLAQLPAGVADDLLDYLAIREQIRRSVSPPASRRMAAA
ncbi:hypothetical protein [Croceibacterium mercuriale]|uniref:hypothetical protein n=1 Tax=Croceibacterium mercuriale TaxID=1572751 RepID=UPI000689BF88|nr:hypothetical protein [Croceibacterium mercuriale]